MNSFGLALIVLVLAGIGAIAVIAIQSNLFGKGTTQSGTKKKTFKKWASTLGWTAGGGILLVAATPLILFLLVFLVVAGFVGLGIIAGLSLLVADAATLSPSEKVEREAFDERVVSLYPQTDEDWRQSLCAKGTWLPSTTLSAVKRVYPNKDPQWVFVGVVPPSSSQEFSIAVVGKSMPVYLCDGDLVGKPLKASELTSLLWDKKSEFVVASSIRVPFKDTLVNSHRSAYSAQYLLLPQVDEELTISISRTYNKRIHEWCVNIDGTEGTSLCIPAAAQWSHLWITPVYDPDYCCTFNGTPVQPLGVTQEWLQGCLLTRYEAEGVADPETAAINGARNLCVNCPVDCTVVPPYGLYYKKNGIIAPLGRGITIPNGSEDPGTTIELGINVPISTGMPRPHKVIIGVSE